MHRSFAAGENGRYVAVNQVPKAIIMLKKILVIVIILILFAADYLTAQWSRIGFEDLEIPTIHSFNGKLVLPVLNNGNTVFYLSDDNGTNWDSIGALPSNIYELQNIGDTLFASSIWICHLFCPSGPSVFRSANTGTSWDTIYTNQGGVSDLIAHNSILFFPEGNKYKKSEDYGKIWSTIEFDPPDLGKLFSINGVLYSSGMYNSTDNGETWISIRGNLPVATVLGISSNDSFLYVFDNDNIYRSNNNGQEWEPINSGIPPEPRIWNLTVNDTYLAATSAFKAYFSKNNGENWTDISKGLSLHDYGFINSILIINHYLLAATDEGLWRYNLSPLVSVEKVFEGTDPNNFRLMQNYPNPFNPTTTIKFALPKSSKVNLRIFNILGEEVVTLVSDRLMAGSYSYEWSRSAGMASGVYIYRLSVVSITVETGNFVETRKMVLIK